MANQSFIDFKKDISERNIQATPFAWASIKGTLGHALVSVKQEASAVETLKQAITDKEAILDDCDPVKTPQDWVEKQLELAAAFHALAQREEQETVVNLNKAMEAYKKLLPLITMQDNPQQWALLLHNIANVFQGLGEHSDGARSLERSVSAYANALTQRTAKAAPIEWALTQNNVAVSMQLLAELKQDLKILKESVQTYDNAQQGLTSSEQPVAWVVTTSNLGYAQIILSEQTKDIRIARQAVDNFNDLTLFFHDAPSSHYLELIKKLQDKARLVVDELKG
ncbi:MAG: hypothetical protein V3V19_05035 [Cocleimonas sp.]